MNNSAFDSFDPAAVAGEAAPPTSAAASETARMRLHIQARKYAARL